MRYVILVCLLGLALAFDLVVYVASSDDSLESFDLLRPATLLPIVAGRLQVLKSQVRALDVHDFFDALAAPYREQDRHEDPIQSPSQ